MSRDDVRQPLFLYMIGMTLLLTGVLFTVWRINLLTDYLAAHRAYVLERDARWEVHIKDHEKTSREILRRLSK